MLPGRLWRSPQNVWARRALFQVHLWAGIGAGIYIFLISVSGSVIVFRNELYKTFVRPPLVVEPSGTALTDDELKAVAKRAYPGWNIANVWRAKNPNQVVELWLERDKKRKQRVFHPYTGADLGASDPAGIRFTLWLVDFHDNLLYGDTGRKVNGAGAILLTVLCITGAVIWWPGISSWRRSLVANWTGNWKRFNWGLHSALGFWSFAFVFVWAVSGIYLVFPDPFTLNAAYAAATKFFDGSRVSTLAASGDGPSRLFGSLSDSLRLSFLSPGPSCGGTACFLHSSKRGGSAGSP